MAEGTYEYELQRAELLGIEPPNKDDFEAVMREKQEEENARLLVNELCRIIDLSKSCKVDRFHPDLCVFIFILGIRNPGRATEECERKIRRS